MSTASVQQVPSSRSFALDDFTSQHYTEHAVLSIEEIRLQLYSCFTCGVSWLEDHVCLDCAECDGYSLQRPCPCCDGRCASLWKRDLTMSHACGKARWSGTCQLQANSTNPNSSKTREEESRVCSSLNKLTLRS